jgi:hypothetical protein
MAQHLGKFSLQLIFLLVLMQELILMEQWIRDVILELNIKIHYIPLILKQIRIAFVVQ